jgi:hypothetical protein
MNSLKNQGQVVKFSGYFHLIRYDARNKEPGFTLRFSDSHYREYVSEKNDMTQAAEAGLLNFPGFMSSVRFLDLIITSSILHFFTAFRA